VRQPRSLIYRKAAAGAPRNIAGMDVQVVSLPIGRNSPRVRELLAHAPLFRGLSPEELARIAAGTTQVPADRGDVLFRRGDACNGFHLVVFGQVKLALGTPSGAEKVIEILGAGRTFGEAVMFAGKPYMVTATALADALLLHVA
jgi:CRP-like cAMP-binding protein